MHMSPMELIGQYELYESYEGCDVHHRVGLTHGWVARLATKRKVKYGTHCVVIYKDRVELCALDYPTNHNHWSSVEVQNYDTVNELASAIETLTKEKKASCW